MSLSDYLSRFLIEKTQYDIQQMKMSAKMRIENPDCSTKFYRKNMGYSNRELKTIQGYIDELNGKGRNSYYNLNGL